MEYIYLGIILVLVITIILIILLNRPKKNNDDDNIKNYLNEEYNKMKMDLINYVNSSNNDNRNNVYNIFKNIDEKFNQIQTKLESNIKDNFKETNQTFINVTERLTKLDLQQKDIEKLSVEVLSLNNILNDKKTRGIFGEVQLNQILNSVFASNEKIYKEQYKLSNGKIIDAILHAPKPLGSICIDSKFPLETFNKLTGSNNQEEIKILEKQFKADIKKHIDDIKDKYIIKEETSDQAIMFIPAEGVYNEIIKNHFELIEYANKHNVWITSPTSLLSTLTVVQSILINIEKSEKTNLILEELKRLSIEFDRYYTRWQDIEKSTIKLLKEIEAISITSNKINKRFNNINEGKLDIDE